MFLRVLLLSIVLLGAMMIIMGLRMLVKKNGKFPNSSIEANPALRKMGIRCPRAEEIRCFKGMKNGDLQGCAGCSSIEDKIS